MYDRGGRLEIEKFEVTPPGRDPLQRYYESGAFFGGGLSSGPRSLDSEPYCFRRDLNEWVTFDKPGSYSLAVSSSRVSPQLRPHTEQINVRSNTLQFEVVAAAPEWQAQQLASAVAVLDSQDTKEEEKRSALRTLRFLQTREALQELVRRATLPERTSDFDTTAALHAYPDPEAAIEILVARLAAPNSSITGMMIWSWARLIFLAKYPPPPPYPAQDKNLQAAWQEAAKRRSDAFTSILEECYQKAAAFLPAKQGAARAETVQTFFFPQQSNLKLPAISPSDFASIFPALSEDKQAMLLAHSWDRMRSDAMLGPLRRIAAAGALQNRDLRAAALRRLYELDPVGGEEAILAEIRSPHRHRNGFVTPDSLTILRSGTLPQLDDLLAARLADPNSHTRNLDAVLLARYATRAPLDRVKEAYAQAREPWDCEAEDGLFTYLLRADKEYGVSLLKTKASPCLARSLEAVRDLGRFQEVEPRFVAGMNDKNWHKSRMAAETLARYGGDTAKKALFERLKAFHAQWKDREAEFTLHPKSPEDVREASSFHFGLVQALGTAEGWILNEEEVDTVEQLSLGPHRQNVTSWRRPGAVDIHPQLHSDRFSAQVAMRYECRSLDALVRKLKQFPPGTRFRVHYSIHRLSEVKPLVAEAASLAGVVLDESTP